MGSQDEGSYSRILLEQRPAFTQRSLGSVTQEPHESAHFDPTFQQASRKSGACIRHAQAATWFGP